MKIVCVGRNYVDHIHELGNQIPTELVLFMKPETALIDGNEYPFPKISENIHFELELVLRISKTAKSIQTTDFEQYIDGIGLGIDFTARDLQTKLKTAGLPWEKAKAFDGSAMISEFKPWNSLNNFKDIKFQLWQNEQLVQDGSSTLMMYNFGELLAEITRYFTLEEGDLVFTGTPKGVGPIKIRDHFQAKLEDKTLLDFKVVH